jgi:hypothetical protein
VRQGAAAPNNGAIAKGVAAGVVFGLLKWLSVHHQGHSLLGSLLRSVLWASIIFFFVARGSFGRLRDRPRAMQRLSRSQRQSFRRSFRACELPNDPYVRAAAIDYLGWLAKPVPLERLELTVMSAWTLFGVGGAVVALTQNHWHPASWLAFAALPAFLLLCLLLTARMRGRARRLVALAHLA